MPLSAKDLLTPYQAADHEQATIQAILLLQAKQKKRQAAELAAGHLVRITFHANGTPTAGLYPARVAAFICKVLGQQLPNTRGIRFDLTTQGRLHSAYYPAKQAELAVLALISRAQAEQKAINRRLRAEQARHAQQTAQAVAAIQ